MVGKNNKFLKENKNNQRFLRFSLRKLSVGVVSVAIAAGFYVGGSQSVLADTTSTDPVVSQSTSNDNLAESTDKNTVNLQNSSTSTDPSAVASAADSTAAEAGKSAVPAAEQQKTATFNVAEEKPVAALNTANLLDNKAQSSAAPDAATVNDDDLLKNIKISNPTDPKFIQYQDLVDSYMSDHYGEEKPSQYVFSVISDSRIDTDFIWTVDKDTGKKVSVYFNDWYRGITGYHQFIDADFDDNHNDYRYSNSGVTLSYDKSEGSSGSVSVVDDNHDILDLGDANLQDVYEINGNTDNSRSDSFAITLPEKGQPIIKFLYRNPDTGKLMDLRAPIYYSNGLTGQKFELDIGDSYKQELKDMFAGFKLVGSSKASGTFTQFAQGKTYVEHDASDDSEVIYQQIDAEGTMKVFYRGKDGEKQPVLDEYGNPCQLKAGSSIKIDTGNSIITAYNPFVTGDHAYELIYEPKYRNQVVNYVDHGKVIKSDTITGKITQTVDVTPSVPDHYELVPGQNIPSEVTLKDKNTPIIVKVQPKMDDITDPSQLTKAISRTITINVPHQTPIVEKQSANFTRTGQHNEVTGEDVYTGWTLKDNTLEAVDAPAVPGYTPNVAHVDGVKNPTADTKLNDVVINYTADDRNQVVNYVDPNGKVVKTDTVKGKTDETVKVTPNVPDHYELVPGQNIPSEVTLKDKNTPIIVKVQPKMDDITDPSQLTKAISRTITINVPHQTPIVEKQSANFTRTGQHNEVTGEDVYTGWTLKDNSLRHVDVPAIPGYTPSQNTVDGIATPAVDTPVSDITVNYKANEQTGQITYVDEKGNQISSTPLTGKTDEDIAINPVAPAGWELVPGQKYPATVTATADGIPGVTLTVRHHMINVVPGDVPTPGDKKTGNNDKKPGDGTPNKDITHEDLNKTITRTFIVKAPTGTMTKTQHISYQRTATIDDVTGDVTFSDWNTDGASFKAEVIPAISGYTSHVTEGNYGAYAPSQDQINNWTDPMITVTYTANDQSQVINYVDDHNKTIKTDTVKGKTDETVKVTPNVPDHYELVPGQNIPSEVTLKDKNTPIIVKVQPKMDDITDPSQLTKAISRTITINVPHQTPIVENQSANFTRTGQHNEVTGEDVYTGWTLKDNTLEAVDAPAVPGYTPNVAHVDGVKNPTADTKLNDVVINYTADDRNQVVNYVDPNGKVVKTDTVKGKTDETVKVTPNVPDHYELVPGQNIPSEVTLKDKNTPIIVKVQPKMDDITDPSQLTKAISRTITINVPHQTPIVENQSANFTRTGQHNEVTGEDVYTGWTLKDNTLEAVDAPAVPGYTPNVAHVDGVKNPTADTKLNDVVINYTADDRNQVVNYVDPNGKVVKTDTVKGKTDETVKVTPNVPDHYELVPGQNIPSEVTLKDKNTPIIVKVQPKMDDITDPSQLTKAISRTITINVPHQTPIVENQSANFTRTGQHNEVTGEDVYTGWTLKDNSLRHVDVPAIPGYTPSQNTVDGIATPAVDTPVSDITVNYKANEQTGQITYVDEKGNQISSTPLTGKTDEDIAINPVAPAGWELVPGQKYPATVTATADGIPGVTLTVRHHMINVVPGDVPTPGDKKTGNNDKKPGDGTPNKDITHEDLNKTITRTFIVKAPTGTMTKTQHISYQRTATIDDVTGDVTFSDWNTDGASFKAEVIPAISGYTSHVTEGNYGAYAPSQDQINNWTDPMITVTYTANDQSQVINYVDDHNKTIKTDTVKGKTDETVKVTPNVPDHYELVPGQNIPSEVTLKDKNTPIIVKVQPKMDDITDPSQLTKAISRTITINVPHQTPIVENQSANFTRTGQHNEVTGEDVYTGWTLKDNTLEAVDAPAVPGYTPNVAHVDGVKNPTADTKLNDVVINYTADDRNQVVNYVDPNGKVVKTDTVKGKTDETVKVTPNVPDHYELVPGQNIPSEVTLKDKNTPIIVKVQPKMDDITDPSQLTKAISRTITINVPHQTPIVENQSANFTRTGQHNEVTGKDVYTGWTLKDNTLEAVDAPAVPGYTPNVAHVDGVKNPTADTKLNDVVINYTADDRNQVVNYVDPNGKVVKTDTVKGKTDETVKVTPNVPDHYELVPGQNIPSEVTLKDKNTPIIVKVQPKMDDITDPSQLTKAISRTITINVPHQTPIVENQSANFTRTGQHNEVTGKDVYTGWTLKDNTLEAVDAPAVPGYTPNVAHVDGVKNPTADTKLNDVVINYTADDRNQVVNYVDPNGKVVKTDTVKGKTDETVKVTPNVPDHYELVPGQNIPSEVTLKDKNTPIIVKVQPKMDDITDPSQLTKAISRTITINVPHQTPIVEKQSANFTRTGQHNEVTGEDVYTGWTLKDNTLEAVDAPAVPGYTPNVAHVDGVKNPTADTKLNDVVINYTADDRNQVVNYVDPNGKVVKTDTVKGKTDETVKVTPNVPDHYELVPGQNIPSEVTLKDKNTPIIVKVQPKVDSITDPAKLNKSISRTITINKPGEKPQVINQTATFKRTGKTNEVTGITTYTPWVLDQNGLTTVSAPEVPGYTPSQKTVASVDNPTTNTKLTDVTINYTANSQTTHINYVDKDGETVKSDTVSGKTDETVKTNSEVPAGWKITDGQIPETIHFTGEETPDTTITIEHDTTSVDHIKPVKPGDKTPSGKVIDGAHESDLNQTITRTINVTTPDGQTTTTKQVAKIFRDATIDDVTGEVTYGSWSEDTWADFKPGQLAGYTASQADVPAVTVDSETTDQTVDITYAAVATPAQPEHQAPTASDTPDAQQATNQKADSNAQPAVTVVTSQQTATAQQAESTTNSRRLPQTGNSHDASALAGLGLASLMGLFGLGGKRRKRD